MTLVHKEASTYVPGAGFTAPRPTARQWNDAQAWAVMHSGRWAWCARCLFEMCS